MAVELRTEVICGESERETIGPYRLAVYQSRDKERLVAKIV